MELDRMLLQCPVIMQHILELFDLHKIVALEILSDNKVLLLGQALDFVLDQVSDYHCCLFAVSQLKVKMTSHLLLLYHENILRYGRKGMIIKIQDGSVTCW